MGRVSPDPFPLQEDGQTASRIDVSGRQAAGAFMEAAVVIMVNEGGDLGGVDKVLGPNADSCELDEAEVACGGLVISGCHAPSVLHAAEGSLDAVA